MKMSKRIFIVLLTFAVMISSFAIFASASEDTAVTIDNYNYVLEYYEEPVIFGFDIAEGNSDYADALIMSNPGRVTHSVVADDTAPTGSYLNLQITSGRPWKEENVYFSWNNESGVDEFYFDVTLSGGCVADGTSNYPKYRLTVGEEALAGVSEAHSTGISLLVLDFKYGQLSYLSGVDAEGAPITTLTDYVISPDAWYDVTLDYDAVSGVCTVVVTNTADAEDTVTISDVYTPYELVKNVRFGVNKTDTTVTDDPAKPTKDLRSNGNVWKIASISAAGGSARRNLADTQQGVEDAILEIYALYTSEGVSIDDKIGLCNVTNTILGYGFTSDNEEVNAAIADLKFGSVTLYSDEIAEYVDLLGTLNDYYEKKACVEEATVYADILSDMDLSPVGEENMAKIEADIATVYAAGEALIKAEQDSLAYIELLCEAEEDSLSTDYQLLLEYYTAAEALEPDLTYEGVAEVHVYYLNIVSGMEDISYQAEAFVATVDYLANESVDFMKRYNRYLNVKDIIYDNETYPGMTETLARYNDEVVPAILYEASLSENFVKLIESADYAKYISAKEEYIAKADEYIELCHPDFPGVSDAKELRLEILEHIAEQKQNAKNYIDAVNALDSLSGSALLTGITNAQKLQTLGNVLGVPGVTEANIKLNQIVSSIELREKYNEYFITAVESLNYLYKLSDMYAKIVEAKAAELQTDPSYPGVSEASSDLEFFIESYNSIVEAVNADFVTANLVAADTVGIGETSNVVADNVIALIQTFFYEEEDDDEEETE